MAEIGLGLPDVAEEEVGLAQRHEGGDEIRGAAAFLGDADRAPVARNRVADASQAAVGIAGVDEIAAEAAPVSEQFVGLGGLALLLDGLGEVAAARVYLAQRRVGGRHAREVAGGALGIEGSIDVARGAEVVALGEIQGAEFIEDRPGRVLARRLLDGLERLEQALDGQGVGSSRAVDARQELPEVGAGHGRVFSLRVAQAAEAVVQRLLGVVPVQVHDGDRFPEARQALFGELFGEAPGRHAERLRVPAGGHVEAGQPSVEFGSLFVAQRRVAGFEKQHLEIALGRLGAADMFFDGDDLAGDFRRGHVARRRGAQDAEQVV